MATAGIRDRKRRRTREAIVSAARELFTEKGYHETSLAEIAERADIATSTLPGYFATKADILFEGIDEILDSVVAAVAARPEGETAVEALARVNANARWHESNPDLRWHHVLWQILQNDPTLDGLMMWKSKATNFAIAAEVADDLGECPGALRPRLLAAIQSAVYYTMAEHAYANGSSAQECGELLAATSEYVTRCFTEAARAVLAVAPPAAE